MVPCTRGTLAGDMENWKAPRVYADDADYTTVLLDSRLPASGGVVMLGGGTTLWFARMQWVRAVPRTEAWVCCIPGSREGDNLSTV